MPTPCPACAFQVKNAPECPRCGHPMDEPPALDFAKGLTRAVLEDLVDEDPLVARAMDLIFRLEEVAPEIAAWRELPEASRGPPPAISPEREPVVRQLLAEMARVSTELDRRETGPAVH